MATQQSSIFNVYIHDWEIFDAMLQIKKMQHCDRFEQLNPATRQMFKEKFRFEEKNFSSNSQNSITINDSNDFEINILCTHIYSMCSPLAVKNYVANLSQLDLEKIKTRHKSVRESLLKKLTEDEQKIFLNMESRFIHDASAQSMIDLIRKFTVLSNNIYIKSIHLDILFNSNNIQKIPSILFTKINGFYVYFDNGNDEDYSIGIEKAMNFIYNLKQESVPNVNAGFKEMIQKSKLKSNKKLESEFEEIELYYKNEIQCLPQPLPIDFENLQFHEKCRACAIKNSAGLKKKKELFKKIFEGAIKYLINISNNPIKTYGQFMAVIELLQLLFQKTLDIEKYNEKISKKKRPNDDQIFEKANDQLSQLLCRDYSQFLGPEFIPRYQNHEDTLRNIINLKTINFVSKEQLICHFIKHGHISSDKTIDVEQLLKSDIDEEIDKYLKKAIGIIKFDPSTSPIYELRKYSTWEQIGGSRTFTFYKIKKADQYCEMVAILVSEFGEVFLKTFFDIKKFGTKNPEEHCHIQLYDALPYTYYMKWGH